MRSLGVLLVVKGMEAFVSWFELHDSFGSEDLEDPPAVLAIISNTIFLSKAKEGKDIGDPVGIKIHLGVAKVGLFCS